MPGVLPYLHTGVEHADGSYTQEVIAMADAYISDGCDVAAHCLQCPLPLCKYDDQSGYQYWKRHKRVLDTVAAMTRDGHTPKEIALAIQRTPRTVERILSRAVASQAKE